MITLYTLKYNNYFNRVVKKEEDLTGYSNFITTGHSTAGVSFNPADGIDTTQIINYDGSNDDYAILCEDNVVKSRWFIIEAVRQRTGQYLLSLKRDVIADNLEYIINDPVFVEKGNLSNEDPMICNDEGMVFNKIKTNEEILISYEYDAKTYEEDTPIVAWNDKKAVPWLVGYVERDKELKEKNESLDNVFHVPSYKKPDGMTLTELSTETGIPELALINILDLGDGINKGKLISNNSHFSYRIENVYGMSSQVSLTFSEDLNLPNSIASSSYRDVATSIKLTEATLRYPIENQLKALKETFKTNDIKEFLRIYGQNYTITRDQYLKLLNFEGSVIVYNNVNYLMNIIIGNVENDNTIFANNNIQWTNDFTNKFLTETQKYVNAERTNNGNYKYEYKTVDISLLLSRIDNANTYNVNMSNNRNKAAGSICDIFVIPFSEVEIKLNNGSFRTIGDKSELINIASTLAKKLDAECYDIQLLPYAPEIAKLIYAQQVPGATYDTSLMIDTRNIIEGADYDIITGDNNTKKSIIFWLSNASTSTHVSLDYRVEDKKISSQIDMLRICSPNGQGYYDLNPAKNDGLSNIKVNITYKPYTPYIQLLPNFNFIYGTNFEKDIRGLICGGDFSITRVKDAWESYELNNKNYQNIFARDIQNLDLVQKQQRIQQSFKVLSGATAGAAGGAFTGSQIGGVYGAAIGAAVGGTAGIVGGIVDYRMAEQMRAETKDYAIDKYNYSLGNVQALPDTISKLSTFNLNNKWLPFIEYYTCTDVEKLTLERKIRYNGMTVNRIGTLREFMSEDLRHEAEDKRHYFSGQYIRCENSELSNDTHLFNTIYDELKKGVYI